MSLLPDYYALLEVPSSASFEEIKKAFRQKAHQFHPDKYPENDHATEQFLHIQEAYSVLSHPKKRQEYHFRKFHKPLHLKEPNFDIVVSELSELKKLLYAIGYDRVDFDLLAFQLEQIIPFADEFLLKIPNASLKLFETDLLTCCNYLPYPVLLSLKKKRAIVFKSLTQKTLRLYLRKRKLQFYLDQFKLLIALIIAIGICILILKSSSH